MLVNIKTNNGTTIEVADIKSDIIKQILELAPLCDKIEYIYIFGPSVEEYCTEESYIDLAIVSNVTRSKLFSARDYKDFTNKLYRLDLNQEYHILQFNSVEAIENSKDFVREYILTKGKLLYSKRAYMQQLVNRLCKLYNTLT